MLSLMNPATPPGGSTAATGECLSCHVWIVPYFIEHITVRASTPCYILTASTLYSHGCAKVPLTWRGCGNDIGDVLGVLCAVVAESAGVGVGIQHVADAKALRAQYKGRCQHPRHSTRRCGLPRAALFQTPGTQTPTDHVRHASMCNIGSTTFACLHACETRTSEQCEHLIKMAVSSCRQHRNAAIKT